MPRPRAFGWAYYLGVLNVFGKWLVWKLVQLRCWGTVEAAVLAVRAELFRWYPVYEAEHDVKLTRVADFTEATISWNMDISFAYRPKSRFPPTIVSNRTVENSSASFGKSTYLNCWLANYKKTDFSGWGSRPTHKKSTFLWFASQKLTSVDF